MAINTTFVDFQTPVPADWLNNINTIVNGSSQIGTWLKTLFVSGGVPAFGYLQNTNTFNVQSNVGQLTSTFAVQSAMSPAGGASIGVASLAINNSTVGAGNNSWCYYGTTVRGIGATGVSTLGMELDVENLGTNVPIYPSSLFPTGLSANLWIAAGGELANQVGAGYTFNNTSAAMVILSNNAGGYANVKFDKGIVFGANALNANGVALALATGHNMSWFNTSNQLVASIQAPVTVTNGLQMIFTNSGVQFEDFNGMTRFEVSNNIASPVNFLVVTAAATGTPPFMQAFGTDTNIDLFLLGQGTGVIGFGTFTTASLTQTGYITIKDSGGTIRRLLVG